jgi:drug/metabolite transporter (DMT)-like permease
VTGHRYARPLAGRPEVPITRSRASIVTWLSVAVVAVSTSAILARWAMGAEPGVADAAAGFAPALAVAFWRCLLGAVALAPLAVRERGAGAVTADHHRQLAASGAFLALHFALFQGSLALTTVASAVTLATMSPIFVALGGWWLLRERTERRTWAGMAITIVGAVVIGAADLANIDLGPAALTGDVMAFLSAVAVTGYLLIGRRVRSVVPAATYSAVVYAWSAALLLPLCLVLDVALWGYDAVAWLAIAGIVAGPQLLGHTVFNTLLSSVSATIVAIVVLTEPVGATLLAWVLLAELPATLFWVGAPLVLVGVTIATARGGARTRAEVAEAAIEH